MSSIDERVVEMKFNESDFSSKVQGVLDSLTKLKNNLKMDGAVRGIENVGNATSQLSGVASSVANSFSSMGTIAVGALLSIGAKAETIGASLIKSLTIDPVMGGMSEYETNLNAIQTILANTKAAGTTLADVNKALGELNAYSDKTIYNFSEMAKNIGTFTAAGVDLDKSVASIKGIANLAALSGSNSEKAAGAMYQLSQAISAGRVSLQDWNSVNTAGMGGTVFQRALAQTAVAMGKINDGAVKLVGPMQNVTVNGKSFRESIDATAGPSWLTSDVLVATLEQFTGDLSDAELAAKGFSKAQIASIQETARTAMLAAQDVKTLSQVFDVAKETAGSGWAQTWQIVFGDFEEAKSTFTSLSLAINSVINASAASRNKLLGDWKELGGRTVLIDGIKYAFQALLFIIRPIRDAFRHIFPATTGKQLYDLTVRFHDFMKQLGPSAATIIDLRRTFAGLFAILRIGWDLFKAGFKFVGDLLKIIFKGGGSFLYFTGNIGDFLVALQNAIEKGKIFNRFFDSMVKILRGPIEFIKRLAGVISNIFSGLDASGAARSLDTLTAITDNFTRIGDEAANAWQQFAHVLDLIWQKMKPFREGVKTVFADAGKALGQFLQGLSFNQILAGIGTGAFVTIATSIRNFLKNLKFGTAGDQASGFISKIKDAIDQLTETLKGLQNALNGAALLAIASAIGILALSVMLLARIPADDLVRATIAIAMLVAALVASTKLFNSKMKFGEAAKYTIIAVGLIAIAIAVRILASAVKVMSELDWAALAKGMSGLTVLLLEVLGVVRLMSAGEKRMVRTGLALILLAAAIKILADAVVELSGYDWVELAKGVSGVGALLLALGLFTRFAKANKAGIGSGTGIILMATSIKILASAVKDIAKLDWIQISKGISSIVVALIAMAGAMKLMPRGGISRGTGLILAATTLLIVAQSLKQIGALSWGKIVKGLVVMGVALLAMTLALKYIPTGAIISAVAILGISAALLIIAMALEKIGKMDWSGMAKALVGIGAVVLVIGLFIAAMAATEGIGAVLLIVLAGSLIVIAAALYIIAQALQTLGAMSWSDIGAAIGGLAALFVVLALGGLLSPLIGALAIALGGLAAAIALAGGGIALAGAGVLSFASAMTVLSHLDSDALNNVVTVLKTLIGLIPGLAVAVSDAVVAFVTTLGENAPAMADSFGKLIDAFVQVIVDDIPNIVAAFSDMISLSLRAMADRMPDLIQAGADLIVNVLQGLADNADRVATAGANLVVATLNSMGREIPRMATAGADMVITLLNGIADTVRTKGPELRKAGSNLVGAIFEGMFGGVDKNEPSLMDRFKGMATNALTTVMHTLGMSSPSKKFMQIGQYAVQGFTKGLQGNRQQVTDAVNSMLGKLNDVMDDARRRIDSAQQSLEKLTSARKKDYAAIQKQRDIITEANWELNKASETYTVLSRNLAGYHHRLRQLADESDGIAKKLDTANQALADAKKTRDDYFASLHDQYDNLPEITGKTSLTKYMSDFQRQITDTQAFATAIQELRKRGLNDTMYKELLAKGPEIMPFIQQILAQGSDGVKQLNSLGTALDQASTSLAQNASTSLYQAGVNAAQGLVDGLKKQAAAIDAEMRRIATVMVRAIKTQLGIQSPSKVMQDLGMQTGAGMAKGLQDSAAMVAKSAQVLGNTAIDSMRKTITGLSSLISDQIDPNPTIAPVLDLNAVRKDAATINSMLGVKPIDIQSQISSAKDASAGLQANQVALADIASGTAGERVVFNQNNYSPKALSAAEIYRQTNNQLSRAKGALATNAN